MPDWTSQIGRLTSIHTQDLALQETFLDLAARFASVPGTVILISGGDHDCARHHILATRPWLTHRARHADNFLQLGSESFSVREDPLEVARAILTACAVDSGYADPPVCAGLFGYLAYDLKGRIEDLPCTAVDDLHLPHLYLCAPSIVVVHDRLNGTTRLHIPVREPGCRRRLAADLAFFERTMEHPRPDPGEDSPRSRPLLRSNLSRPAYEQAVARIQEYIKAGHVYQVNMSQRFCTEYSGSGFELFRRLFDSNPAPFFAYVNAEDHEIVSTSPERFLLQQGRFVETRPIKGTRPRGSTPEEDRRLRQELSSSVKDQAELSMIVDLLRNDLGKVCAPGTVRVAEHKRLEAYTNVTHLVSRVVGELDHGQDSIDLIRAAFPGGSITGCPKVRSMEIIDEREAGTRHIYTGSIGYLSFHQTMDLSIAIRTATLINETLLFSVGGGVVFDSSPEDEYEETLHKGRTFFEVIAGHDRQPSTVSQLWHNGRLVPEREARISALDLGFQYGFGLFETIRADQGHVHRLSRHIQRLRQSWQALSQIPFPELDWETVVQLLLRTNGLESSTAAVKIILSTGSRSAPPYDRNILVTARSYSPFKAASRQEGIRLLTYPHPRLSPMAGHKTLNHLYYHLAGLWARERNADHALILNPEGTVSETHAAGLLALRAHRVVIPESSHVLPSLMTEAVLSRLQSMGLAVTQSPLHPRDLHEFDHLLVANSLLGTICVTELDHRPVPPCHELAAELTERVFDPGADSSS